MSIQSNMKVLSKKLDRLKVKSFDTKIPESVVRRYLGRTASYLRDYTDSGIETKITGKMGKMFTTRYIENVSNQIDRLLTEDTVSESSLLTELLVVSFYSTFYFNLCRYYDTLSLNKYDNLKDLTPEIIGFDPTLFNMVSGLLDVAIASPDDILSIEYPDNELRYIRTCVLRIIKMEV